MEGEHLYFTCGWFKGLINHALGYKGLTIILYMVTVKNMHQKTNSTITKELSIDMVRWVSK